MNQNVTLPYSCPSAQLELVLIIARLEPVPLGRWCSEQAMHRESESEGEQSLDVSRAVGN